MNYICEETGCMYNEDGRCIYDHSDVKIPYARVCAPRPVDDME